jgi:hypothetical protein
VVTIAIDDGRADFESAVVGLRDESKLSIDYNTIRQDHKNTRHTVPGNRVKNRYHLNVDFGGKESVRKLNTGRRQILGRNFPRDPEDYTPLTRE